MSKPNKIKHIQIDITGNAMAFVYDQDIASARVFEVLQSGNTYNIKIAWIL